MGNGLSTPHPLYSAQAANWQFVEDFFEGQTKVKEAGTLYLPATAGQLLDGISSTTSTGTLAYNRYKDRAVVPDYVQEAVLLMQGYLHRKPATFELPPSMQYMIEQATPNGDGLQMLLTQITEQQLRCGRAGLLLDLPLAGSVSSLPYLALYPGLSILNWDEGTAGLSNLNLVVLNESAYVRDGFEWTYKYRYRSLVLGDLYINEPGAASYVVSTFDEESALADLVWESPSYKGKLLNEIPFVFINSTGNLATPNKPPFLGLANTVQSIYCGEADYRHCLHMQSQETLVIINGNPDESVRVGAGALIGLQMGGDAKYIGVSSAGLSEQRLALDEQRREAKHKIGLLLQSAGSVESGDALKTQLSSQTVSLVTIAEAAATGLQRILRIQAQWLGEDPEKVVVTPNLEFIEAVLAGDELVKLSVAKREGVPLSNESLHDLMKKRGLTEMSFEDELAAIAAEPVPKVNTIQGATNSTAPGQAEAQGVKDDNPTISRTNA